jgi:hypothetical protein
LNHRDAEGTEQVVKNAWRTWRFGGSNSIFSTLLQSSGSSTLNGEANFQGISASQSLLFNLLRGLVLL